MLQAARRRRPPGIQITSRAAVASIGVQSLGLHRRARPGAVDLPASPRGIFGVASISHAPSKASRPHLTPPTRRRRPRHPPHRSGPRPHRSSPRHVRAPLASTSGPNGLKISKRPPTVIPEDTSRHVDTSPQSGTPRTARRTGLEPQAAWRRHVKRRRRRGPAGVAAVRSASDAVESTASPPLRHRRDTCGHTLFVCCCIGCSAVNKSGLSLALASIRDPAIIAADSGDRCGHYTAPDGTLADGGSSTSNPNLKGRLVAQA